MHGDVLSGSDDTMTDRDTFDIDEIHGNGSSCADESASDLLTIECVNGISNMRRKPPSMVRSNIGKALRCLLCLLSGAFVFILREKLPMLLLTLLNGTSLVISLFCFSILFFNRLRQHNVALAITGGNEAKRSRVENIAKLFN